MSLSVNDILKRAPYNQYADLRAKLREINTPRQAQQVVRDPQHTSPEAAVRNERSVNSSTAASENQFFYGVVLKVLNEADKQPKFYIDVPRAGDNTHFQDSIADPARFVREVLDKDLEKYNHLIFSKPADTSGIENPVFGAIAKVTLDSNWPSNHTNNQFIETVYNKISFRLNTDSQDTSKAPSISGGESSSVADEETTAKSLATAETISVKDVMIKEKLIQFLVPKQAVTKANSRKFNALKSDTVKKILVLNEHFAAVIASFIKKCWSKGQFVFIDNGLRTYEMQADMFIIGRYTVEPIKYPLITLPGFSAHGVGFSVDLHCYSSSNLEYLKDFKHYEKLNKINQEFNYKLYWRGKCDKWTFGYDDKPQFIEARRKLLQDSGGLTEQTAPIEYLKRAIRRAKAKGKKLKLNVDVKEQSMQYAMQLIDNNRWWSSFYSSES